MSHHTSDKPLTAPFIEELVGPSNKITERMRAVASEREKQLAEALGPTKDFPHGRLVPHDEGGLMFGLTVFNGRVIFDFGKPIRSIGFTREGALELAEAIKQRALQCPAVLFK